MPTSIFRELDAIAADLDSAVRAMESGPLHDRFSAIVARLDEAAELSIGEETQRIALQAVAQQYIAFVETKSMDLAQVEAIYHGFKQALDEEEEE